MQEEKSIWVEDKSPNENVTKWMSLKKSYILNSPLVQSLH